MWIKGHFARSVNSDRKINRCDKNSDKTTASEVKRIW